MKKLFLRREPNLLAKFQAFPYQTDAFLAIRDLEYAAIFHEQGLGKTKIAIDLLLYWLKNTDIDTALIVTKKQLVNNWQDEFKQHSYLVPMVLSSNKKDNFYVFTSPARVVVTNFETLLTENERFYLYLKTRNVAIIVDESTRIKNPESKLTQAFFSLSLLFKKRVIMTGTPVANRPYDIWSQIFFLDNGSSLGKDFHEFKEKTDLTNELYQDHRKRESLENELSSIFSKIQPFTVRENKRSGIISLPQKVYHRETVILEKWQRDFYEKIRHEMILEIIKNGKHAVDDSSVDIKRLLRLVQAVSNPQLIDESLCKKSAKENHLDFIIDGIMSRDEKCIVWTSFIENVDYFQRKYSSWGATKIHGKMKIVDRNRSVEKFKSESSRILFATPSSAKEGLTLTIANNVIFYDRGFSLDDYLQAQDRIHRISQRKVCHIFNLIAANTIDDWVDLLLEAKQQAAFITQGDISKEIFREVTNYSYGELIQTILFPEQGDYNRETEDQ